MVFVYGGDGLVNFQADTILIHRDPSEAETIQSLLFLDHFRDDVFAGLKYLAIEYIDWCGWTNDPKIVVQSLLKFRSLESITILITGYESHHGDILFTRPYHMRIEPPLNPRPVDSHPYDFSIKVLYGPEIESDHPDDDLLLDELLDPEEALAFTSREAVLSKIFEDMHSMFVGRKAEDETWNVPKVDVRVLKKGGNISL